MANPTFNKRKREFIENFIPLLTLLSLMLYIMQRLSIVNIISSNCCWILIIIFKASVFKLIK